MDNKNYMSVEGISEIFDKMVKAYKKLDIWEKKYTLFWSKGINYPFYRKFLGKMESGAWDRYAGDAEVYENEMVRDPCKTLANESPQFINFLCRRIVSIYNELLDIAKAAQSGAKVKELESRIEKFSKNRINLNAFLEESKDKSAAFKLERSVSTKIAEALLWDGKRKIYGYTAETMVMKKLPPANHTIVTLFVQNPEERPRMQRVTDVFEGPESFRLMANEHKTNAFEIFKEINSKTEASVDRGKLKLVLNIKNELKAKAAKSNNENDKKRVELCEAIYSSLKRLMKMKRYCVECVGIHYEMIIRIDKLCRKAMTAILQVEEEHRDYRYDNKTKRYLGEKDKENEEEKRDRYEREREEYYKSKSLIKKLNKGLV